MSFPTWASFGLMFHVLDYDRALISARRPSREVPECVRGYGCAHQCGTVAKDRDQHRQMIQLQSVVECVAEPVSPVKKRQRDHDEQIQTYDWMLHKGPKSLVARRVQPPQGKGQAAQEQMYRAQERGDRSAHAEQDPQKRRQPFRHFTLG